MILYRACVAHRRHTLPAITFRVEEELHKLGGGEGGETKVLLLAHGLDFCLDVSLFFSRDC